MSACGLLEQDALPVSPALSSHTSADKLRSRVFHFILLGVGFNQTFCRRRESVDFNCLRANTSSVSTSKLFPVGRRVKTSGQDTDILRILRVLVNCFKTTH